MLRIIFTDLDGTLLDHTTYSHAPRLIVVSSPGHTGWKEVSLELLRETG